MKSKIIYSLLIVINKINKALIFIYYKNEWQQHMSMNLIMTFYKIVLIGNNPYKNEHFIDTYTY